MNILLDAATLIDCLTRQGRFLESTRKLLLFGALKEYDIWLSATQIPDLHYLLSGGNDPQCLNEAKAKTKGLLRNVHICSIGEVEIDAALESSWPSLDTSLLYEAARKLKADCIVSSQTDSFGEARIPVFNPEGFFSHLEATHNMTFSEVGFESRS